MAEKSKEELQAESEEREYDAMEYESIIDTADKYLEEINNKIKNPVIKFSELSKQKVAKFSESSEPEFYNPSDFPNGFKFMRKYESLSEDLQEMLGGIIPSTTLNPINACIGFDYRDNLLKHFFRIREACHRKLAIINKDIKKLQWKLGKVDNIVELPVAKTPPIVPTPPGTTYPDLEITFIDKDTVMIKVKGELVRGRAYYSDMGFAHKQKPGKQLKAWVTLLKLAKHNGYITFKDNVELDRKGDPIFEITIDDIRGLKEALTICFQLPGDSIKPYEVANCYKTEFVLRYLKEGFESYSPNDDG